MNDYTPPPPPDGPDGLAPAAPTDGMQLVLTIHPPMEMGRFIAIQKAASAIWPNAMLRNGATGYEVLVPKAEA